MTERRLLRTLIVTTVTLVAGAVYYVNTNPQAQLATETPPGYYQVAYFVDGDTLAISMNGQEERVRMIGVDTPETKKPDTPVQCFGNEASSFTKNRIGSKPVRLEADPTGDNRDRYDRLLRYVYLPDGTLLNKQLISEGYAFAYLSFSFSKKAEFNTAQTEAQHAKLGLWNSCEPKLSKGRWQSNVP